ncbi:cytochrome b [Shimia haliotis]|uniref:Cytochrome b561 n=1 Tax=Shimia haliotis TaxID=1280847 RepID=A0A1I4C1I3_9RHOB|nr:cytochrome b/b6 domain-containing protein [Shimia haliotis]SFK74954.1 cytochrome b561 [Shimia haliotis]
MPQGYSKAQIRLHWVIFLLVLLQFTLNGPMSAGWELIKKGEEPVLHPLVVQHVASGLLVLVLVIWRLTIRLKRGAPQLPKEEHPALKGLAHLTHWTLYLMLILMPISGMVAVFADFVPAGDAHGVLRVIMLIFVGLHILGAIFQQFVIKSNILDRMRTPDPD